MLIVILLHFNNALKAQETSSSPKMFSQLLYDKLERTKEDYEKAMAKGDSMEVAEMCYRLGKCYVSLGEYTKAQKCFNRSLKIRSPLGPSVDIGKIYIFTSGYLSKQNKYDESRQHARKAMSNFQAANDQKRMVSAGKMMAGLFSLEFDKTKNRNLLDSALFFIKLSEQKALTIKDMPELGSVYLEHGSILSKLNLRSGIPYIKKACKIFDKEKHTTWIIKGYTILANVYLSLDSIESAKKFLNKACFVRDTSQYDDFDQQVSILTCQTSLYEKTGEWKKALEQFKKIHELLTKVLREDREGAVSRIEIEYETQKKEALLESQKKELLLYNQNLLIQKKLTVISTLGLLIFALAGFVYFRFYRKYKQLSKRNAALVSEQNHRVKNNLQGVTNLLSLQASRLADTEAKNAMEEALLRVEAMALVHQRLYDGNRLIEIDLARFIPELVKGVLRSFSYNAIEPEYNLTLLWVHVDQAISLGLIMNEIVTNSCKYAFPHQLTPILKIDCIEKSNFIDLTVTDNGPGFNINFKTNTFGLQLIRSLTEDLKGKSKYTDKGNRFYLTFPRQ